MILKLINLNFWKNWCDRVMMKILDENCSTKILENVLIPEEIKKYPEHFIPYKIEFDDLILNSEKRYILKTSLYEIDFREIDIKLDKMENNIQNFKITTPHDEYSFSLVIDENKYKIIFNEKNKEEPMIEISKKQISYQLKKIKNKQV